MCRSWRPDIEGKADIVEEIVRIAGLDRVAATPLPRDGCAYRRPDFQPHAKAHAQAKRALAANGLTEAVTWSFISHEQAGSFRRRRRGLEPRQSDRRRSLRHAAKPSAGPRHRSKAQCRSRLRRSRACSKWDRSSKAPRPRTRKRPLRAASGANPRVAGPGRHWAHGARTPIFSMPRPMLSLCRRARRAARRIADRARRVRAGFIPAAAATLQFGPKTIVGHFGQLHPRRARGPRCRRSRCRLRIAAR